jgi:hypothetical protein
MLGNEGPGQKFSAGQSLDAWPRSFWNYAEVFYGRERYLRPVILDISQPKDNLLILLVSFVVFPDILMQRGKL